MELKRDEIRKVLECISRTEDVLCQGCEYRKYDGLACHRIGAKNALALIKELTEENEKLKVNNKQLVNDNAELKKQIQEEISEEDINLYDEFTKLLTEGIRDAKANNLSEIKTRFALHFGTYTDKDMTPITEVFRLLDQIAKEMEKSL